MPLRPALASLLALSPLAAQTWGSWEPASREAPLEIRLAAPTSAEAARPEVRWELANRSGLFHLEFVFAFARPDTPGIPATPGQLLRLAPGQVLSGSTGLPWNPERGMNPFVAAFCWLPSATAGPTCQRPGAPALPQDREAQAARERYLEHLERARREDPEGLAAIAEDLLKGLGAFLPRDPEAAVRFHTRAAERGRVASMLELAQAFGHGTWVPANPGLGTRWYARAAEQGDGMALEAMMERSYHGVGMDRSLPETLRWTRKALAAGDFEAVAWLGRLRQAGQPISQVEWTEAKARLTEAVEEGASDQAYARALLLDEGLDGVRDPVKATATFVALADEGHPDALLKVAERLAEGQFGLPRDPALAWTVLALMEPFALDRPSLGAALRTRLGEGLPAAQRERAEAQAAAFRTRMDRTQAFGLKARLAKARP